MAIYCRRAAARRNAQTLRLAAASATAQDGQTGIDQASTCIVHARAARSACATATAAKSTPETTSYALIMAGSPLSCRRTLHPASGRSPLDGDRGLPLSWPLPAAQYASRIEGDHGVTRSSSPRVRSRRRLLERLVAALGLETA